MFYNYLESRYREAFRRGPDTIRLMTSTFVKSEFWPRLAFAALAAVMLLAIGAMIYNQEHQPFVPDAHRETVAVE